MRSIRSVSAALILLLFPQGVAAAEGNLERFFGAYSGFGFAQDSTGPFINTERDFAMAIGPLEAGGFEIVWQTVKRKGSNPNALDATLSQHELRFRPTDQPGLYHSLANSDPLAGGNLSWAKLDGDYLTVYSFVVEADGVPELHVYRRLWTAKGLELFFSALRDGEEVRTVRGRYTRH